ncbi:Asp-tRNA(Asn)/Glu-tRNA(Gln) amidotransferase subunit GatA [archaeon]|jgi:aspartyl-tRNA(Asn)/glutamyl-tRNA(Gln) amidotransferase subunit A|nr:Asp-tRNA(Asn)/Glu-tRNA(Gln) amidotransferase subunit GatA [archaeon]MBT7128341.1 Asp-tRNA(Asn)/Glu-tRNA(Gln) amidotransferase subunit GatA [archaeon]
MTLKTKLKQIQSGKLSAVENVLAFSKQIATPKSKDLNIFLELNEDAIEQAKAIDKKIKAGTQGKLAGLCFAIKANISAKHMIVSCASKTLENYTGPFNASVVNKLINEDAILLGMLNMDEFACGGSGETSAFGPTKNPTNPELIPGGSSSGPAAAIAADLADFTLGSDTGGSIRNPASHCGIVGLKPTYGAVSRYGLIDMAMSLDCIGPLARTPEDCKLIFDIIKGQDNFDQTTRTPNSQLPTTNHKGVIGLVNIKEFADKRIANLIEEQTKKTAKQHNWKIKKIDLPLDIAIQTYYIIVYTEVFSCTRKFDGRRFGKKIEDTAGPEVMRRIIGGSEITKAEHEGKYYREALKARNHIKQEFEKIFEEVDAIILPTSPAFPHKIGEKISTEEMYNYDTPTVLANIVGLPAISIPAGKIDDKHIGLQVMAPHFQEELLFKLAKNF